MLTGTRSHETCFKTVSGRMLWAASLLALIAALCAGCAANDPPAASSGSTASTPSGAPAPTTEPSTKGKHLDAAAPTATADARTAAPAKVEEANVEQVKVESVSPDELKKYVADQHGKVVLIDFWATYCLPCREKFPRTLALAKKYADQGLTTVSMSMDSPDPSYQKKIVEFLTQQNSEIKNFANRLEDTDAAFAALDIDGGALPHYKVYGRNGKIRNKFGGDPDHPFDESDIEKAVVAALKER